MLDWQKKEDEAENVVNPEQCRLAQKEIAAILNTSNVKPSDCKAFQSFALNVVLMVVPLTALEGPNGLGKCLLGMWTVYSTRYSRDSFVELLWAHG